MGTIGRLLKGYGISAVIFIILTGIVTLLLKATSLTYGAGEICLFAAMAAACLFLGFFTGNLFGKRGLLYGLLFSAVLIFVIVFLTMLAFSVQFSQEMIDWKFLIPLFFGGIGGICGANFKN